MFNVHQTLFIRTIAKFPSNMHEIFVVGLLSVTSLLLAIKFTTKENFQKLLLKQWLDTQNSLKGISASFATKVFSTGQALGGHKRHCREPVRIKEAPCNGESQEEEIRYRCISFDLNELPERDKTIIMKSKGDKAPVNSFCKEKVAGKVPKSRFENDPKTKLKISNPTLKIHEQKTKHGVCNQKSGSEKSLYGHMKSYTEKNRTDMKNNDTSLPVSHSRSPIPSDSARQNRKLRSNLSLPKWSKIGKRTPRKAPRRVSASSSGAGDILALGNEGAAGQQILPPKKRKLQLPFLSNESGSIKTSRKVQQKKTFSVGKEETDFKKQYLCESCRRSFTSYGWP